MVVQTIEVEVKADVAKLENAIERAKELNALLEETKKLTDELASKAFLKWLEGGATPNEIRSKLGLDLNKSEEAPGFIKKYIDLGEAYASGLALGQELAASKDDQEEK